MVGSGLGKATMQAQSSVEMFAIVAAQMFTFLQILGPERPRSITWFHHLLLFCSLLTDLCDSGQCHLVFTTKLGLARAYRPVQAKAIESLTDKLGLQNTQAASPKMLGLIPSFQAKLSQ